MTDKTIRCWKDCPMHSLSKPNACVYKRVHDLAPIGYHESVTYGEPCRHPEVFRALISFINAEGKLELKLE